jgi:uncharacterized protein
VVCRTRTARDTPKRGLANPVIEPSATVTETLVKLTLERAWMRDSPLHGEMHWRCVAATGLALGRETPGADLRLVMLFGLLHDTRRENEHADPGHGVRAAAFARELHGEGVVAGAGDRIDLLCHALELHSDGLTSVDPTVAVCWDADRLHLPRVGRQPWPDLFSTDLAREDGRLEDAARLREAPPAWDAILAALTEPR